MIKAHNIRHALLGAIAFIAIGSFGACSTDPTAPNAQAVTAPAQTSSLTANDTVGATTVYSTNTVSTLTKPKCILIDNVWHCTNET